MDSQLVAKRGLFRALAVLTGPVVAVLLILVLAGELAPGPAALAVPAVIAGLWIPFRRHLLGLRRLGERLNRLDETAAPERVHLESPLVSRPLATAIADAAAAQHRRLRALAVRSASSEAILASLPDPIIAIDRDRRIVRTTSGTTALLGADPAGADLATALRDPAVLEAVARVVETGEHEEVYFRPSGNDVELAARIVALPETTPDGTTALIGVSDVTAIRRSERTRADFIANASHELRTPISVLLGCIQTLRGAARDDEEARERFLAMMDDQAGRMNRLVGDLLSLSKIELNEHRRPSDAVELLPVIGHVIDALQFAARSREITVRIESALERPIVTGDHDELTQLFQNLIDNAIKYGRAGSTVTVEIAAGDIATGSSDGEDAVRVSVRDQGDGIPPAHLKRLTERFYRVDTARSREMGGTGLGLAIVKHIVGRHRGTLSIDSEIGHGSAFTVSLPHGVIKP